MSYKLTILYLMELSDKYRGDSNHTHVHADVTITIMIPIIIATTHYYFGHMVQLNSFQCYVSKNKYVYSIILSINIAGMQLSKITI